MKVHIALVMSLVAMLGAVTAYRTAFAEQETGRLERMVAQGKTLGLTTRRTFIDSHTAFRRLDDLHEARITTGTFFANQANGLRAQDATRAAGYDLLAQEEFAVAAGIQPILNYTRLALPAGKDLDDRVDRLTASSLERIGFDIELPQEGQPGAAAWDRLETAVRTSEHRVMWLAVVIVVFVVSLACFTFAQVVKAESRWVRRLEWAGGAVAAAALIGALAADPHSWKELLEAFIAFAVLVPIGWQVSKRMTFLKEKEDAAEPTRPGELEPGGFAGIRMHGPHNRHPFGLGVVVLIVVAALMSALTGFWYAQASTLAGRAAGEALDRQVQIFNASARPSAVAYHGLESLATAVELRIREQAQHQQIELARQNVQGASQLDPLARLALTQARLADRERVPAAMLDGGWGPESDPRFPARIVSEAMGGTSDEDFAMWDAKNALSAAWHQKATTELAVLTCLAISLYLFGQALGMGPTHAAGILVCLSIGLLLFGTWQSLAAHGEPTSPISHGAGQGCTDPGTADHAMDPAEDAARHYANGRRLYAAATDSRGYTEAAKEFQCAVDARPTFALANVYLARATVDEGTPQEGEGYVSLTSPAGLSSIVDHQETALRALAVAGFVQPEGVLGDHAFNVLMLALSKHDAAGVAHSIEVIRAALLKDHESLWLRFNLAVSLLAGGQKDEALALYEAASKKPITDRGLGTSAITDLGILSAQCPGVATAAYCRDLVPRIDAIKARLAAAMWPAKADAPSAPNGDRPPMTQMSFVASPAGLGWHARLQNLSATRDSIVALWYAYDHDWKTWRVVPAVSGLVDWNSIADDESGSGTFDNYLSEMSGRHCTLPGDYRAEFYVNGRLIAPQPGQAPGTLAAGSFSAAPFDAAQFRGINMAMCHPRGWEKVEAKRGEDPGPMRGYVQPAEGRGAFAFSYYFPKIGSASTNVQRVVDQAMNVLWDRGLISQGQLSRDLDPCRAFPEAPNVRRDVYRNAGTRLLIRSWLQNVGTIHIGIVVRRLGPGSQDDERARVEDCGSLLSFTQMY